MSCEANLMNASSYLSPSIKFILVESRNNLTSRENNNFVTQTLTFDWNYILCHTDLPSDVDFEKTSCQIWTELWSVFADCYSKLQKCRSPPIHLWQWTNCIEEVQNCYRELKCETSSSSITPLKSVLLMTSIFENALGNVYQCKNLNVPFLLKDLLASVELLSIFGKFPMLIAKALLGTPLAFNIRNVCWHGFPAPEEVHPDIAAALVVLITSFGEILCNSQIIAFSSRPRMNAVTWNTFLPLLTSTGFPNLLNHTIEVREVIRDSHFIPKSHIAYWEYAFDYFCQGKNGECLILLLPAFEHTLRCVFCSINCCASRVLVAEQHTLYTTMDEMLDQFFVKSEEVFEKNQLTSLLGQKIMEMLMDILHSFGGPRLRDKLSHGECALHEIPAVVSNYMFCIALSVLLKLESPKRLELNTVLKSIEETFIPSFHSISFLNSETVTVLKKIQALSFDSKMFEGTNVSIKDDVMKLKTAILGYSKSLVNCSDNIIEHIDFFLKQPLETLHRTKADMSIIGSLRKIILAVGKACDNSVKTLHSRQHHFNQHMLRSRQRATFFRFLEFVPSFQIVLNCILLIVMIQLHTLPEILINLKYFQQYSENLASLSSQEKNRWVEIEEKSIKFCEHCTEWLQKVHTKM